MDSDDELPPPLEDMSEHLQQVKAKKQNVPLYANNNDDEEVRLVPKK